MKCLKTPTEHHRAQCKENSTYAAVLAAPIDDVKAATKDGTDTTPKNPVGTTMIDPHLLLRGNEHIMTEMHLETTAVDPEAELEADAGVHQEKDHRVVGNQAKKS